MSDRVDDLDKAYTKALAHEKAGEIDKAAQGYQDCLRLDPADHGGASVRLAAMGRGQIPQKAPDAYVETLFDQHADQFDDILTGHLGYAVPMQLASLFQAAPPAGGSGRGDPHHPQGCAERPSVPRRKRRRRDALHRRVKHEV